LATLQNTIISHFIAVFILLLWGAFLLTNTIAQKQNSIIDTVHEMSLGIFKPFLKPIQDPLFQSDSIRNHFVFKSPSKPHSYISKQIKTHHLKHSDFVFSLQNNPNKLFDSIILQIEIKISSNYL